MTGPRLTSLAQTLPASVPFVGPEAQERTRGAAFAARLGANESVFGPSPKAIEAMQSAASEAWMYADPEAHDLKQALALRHKIAPQNIMVGEGIDGLLGTLVRLIVGRSDTVVTSDGAYPTFNYHVAGFGGALHKVPYQGDFEDPSALFAKAAEINAKLVYIANPDNPMGTQIDGAVLTKALDDLPAGCLLILDEAYIDTAPAGSAPEIAINDPRVIRMRTFSKAYGLAGARVGYALGAPDLIEAFHKVRNHFGMSRISLAGAVAALADQDHLTETLAKIETSRDRIAAIAVAHGLVPIPSATNFVAVDCGQDGAFAARILDGLIAEGIFVRMPFVAPQNRCIRVSCGTDDLMDLFETALPKALNVARG